MKVLLVYKFFIPHWGGIETLMYSIAKGLSRYCEEVAVLTTANHKTKNAVEEVDGIKVIRIPAFITFRKIDVSFSVLRILSIIKKYDIIYIFGCLPSSVFIYTLLFGKLNNRLIAWHPAYYPSTTRTYQSDFSKMFRIIHDKIFLKLYSNFVSIILASTEEEVYSFSKIFRGKIYLVGECVNDPPPVAKSKVDEVLNNYKLSRNKYILNVGRIVHYKGQDLLINAWRNVEKDFPEFKLILVGEDWGLKCKLISMINEYNLRNVVFAEGVDTETLHVLYEEALAVVSPSRFEAFHRVALEAWSHKKPIIALDLGGPTRHITPESGILVRESSGDLEKALRKVISRPHVAKILGENGYRLFRNKYATDAYAQNLVRIFRTCFEKNSY
uniref:Glycosyltransferase n=1 Tax=Fervidicoccus fontis TaxID=683846 RepID=A0A7J3SKL4_9CREN